MKATVNTFTYFQRGEVFALHFVSFAEMKERETRNRSEKGVELSWEFALCTAFVVAIHHSCGNAFHDYQKLSLQFTDGDVFFSPASAYISMLS